MPMSPRTPKNSEAYLRESIKRAKTMYVVARRTPPPVGEGGARRTSRREGEGRYPVVRAGRQDSFTVHAVTLTVVVMKFLLYIVAVLVCLASSPALAAEGPAYGAAALFTGGAVALVALLVMVFSILLPFVRTGWLRWVCLGAFALVAFTLFFIGGFSAFKDMMGNGGYAFLAGFATSAALTFGLIRWLNARAQARIEKNNAPQHATLSSPLWEKPQPKGNAEYRKIDKHIKIYKSLSECCGFIALLAAGLGVITLFHGKSYAPGARESVFINASIIAAVLGLCWLALRQWAKRLEPQARAVFWGATPQEAAAAAETEVDGDTRDRHETERVLEYVRSHAADIADFEQRFIAQMTQRHAVSADAAAAMLKASIDGQQFSLAAVWHAEGIAPEKKANDLAYVLHRTAAYDARIFPAAAGYSAAGRVFFWCLAAFLVAMYVLRRYVITDYISSPDWRGAGGWLALAFGIGLSAWLVWMQRSGKMPGRRDGRKAGWGTGLLLACIFVFILWLFVMPAIGGCVTALFGEVLPSGKKISWFGEISGR